MSASPYDAPLSAIRSHVENTAVWITIWEARKEPDAHARRCASDAVDAIDAALAELHKIRACLISELRASDDRTAARIDKLLAGRARDQELSEAIRPENTEGRTLERPARERYTDENPQ